MSTKLPWYVRLASWLHTRGKFRDITERDDPSGDLYMRRYFVFRFWIFPHVYLHRVVRSDSTPDFHDHPWAFFHLILENGYIEEVPWGAICVKRYYRRRGYWAFHRARYQHRVELQRTGLSEGEGEIPSWSLVVTGPRLRRWGFIRRMSREWVYWRTYLGLDAKGY